MHQDSPWKGCLNLWCSLFPFLCLPSSPSIHWEYPRIGSSLQARGLKQTEQTWQPQHLFSPTAHTRGHSFLGGCNGLQLRLESTESTTEGKLRRRVCAPSVDKGAECSRAGEQGARRRGRGNGGAGGREGCAAPLRVFLLMAISAFSRQTKARAWLMSLPVKLFKQTLHIKTEWLIAKPETRA